MAKQVWCDVRGGPVGRQAHSLARGQSQDGFFGCIAACLRRVRGLSRPVVHWLHIFTLHTVKHDRAAKHSASPVSLVHFMQRRLWVTGHFGGDGVLRWPCSTTERVTNTSWQTCKRGCWFHTHGSCCVLHTYGSYCNQYCCHCTACFAVRGHQGSRNS